MVRRAPILPEIVRQHAEMAAFLWTVYDRAQLFPEENPELDEVRMARLLERLEAHLDGLRVAADEGRRIAGERYADHPEPGELFVVRMTSPEALGLSVAELDLDKVRAFIAAALPR